MPTVTISSKLDAPNVYELFQGDTASSLLVSCLNGLGLTQGVWKPIYFLASVVAYDWYLS